MGLFDIFHKRNGAQRGEPSPSLARICYDIAYVALPHNAFNNLDKLVQMFTDGPVPPGPYFYIAVCQAWKIEPVHENVERFREHYGRLDEARDYFVLEYPTPPPVDFSGIDLAQIPRGEIPVLAPYFSAIIRHHQTGMVDYYTLGQSPTAGETALRMVTPDDMNCNLGPGPEPQLEAFLRVLRSRK